jgi:uncharacterized protein (DUF1800 family)
MHSRMLLVAACLGPFVGTLTESAFAQSAPLGLTISNNVKTVHWPLVPALESYQLATGTTINQNAVVSPSLILRTPGGYSYTTSNTLAQQFFKLRLTNMSSQALLTANLFNRIAYGPTPDDLERVLTGPSAIGPDAYIEEQLAPEAIPSSIDNYVAVTTNGVTLPAITNWNIVTVTGTVSSPVLYLYLRDVGQMNVDALDFRYSYTLTAVTNNGTSSTTNVYNIYTTNLVINGDFEQPLTTGWTVSTNLTSSYLDSSAVCSGANSLRIVSTSPGSTTTSAIWQQMQAVPVTTRGTNQPSGERWTNTVSSLRGILTFAYLPNAISHLLTIRLSGSGTIIAGKDQPETPEWIYATATGIATGTPVLYAYLASGAGEAYIDDLKLVSGPVPEAGPNLVVNGDFEQPFSTGWQASTNFDTSYVDNTVSHSGTGSLHLIAESAGGGNNSAVFQTVPVTNTGVYTVSYWYRPPTRSRPLVVRLSGSGTAGLLQSTPERTTGGQLTFPALRRKLDDANWSVALDDLRAWFCQNAVSSPRQLLEILTQFCENHFVTQHSKTSDYFDRYYDGLQNQVATDLEYREISRWRAALMNPNCTFYDLMKVHVESPAEIIYLDTVGSRGDGTQVANENYARELFELFAMGVDNGYDQNDIVVMSRAWTGWTIDIVERSQVDNPFATRSGDYSAYPGVGYNAVSNIIGVWSFVFNSAVHGTNRAPILSVWDPASPATNPRPLGPKRYPARFGPPWANTSYQLVIPPNRTGTNGIRDGYDVIRHLSTNLFTAEFISVKLCRLFVHDDFVHGVYDYADPNRSPEAELIRQCILAWLTPGPGTVEGRGNIRNVLRAIFSSELFRSHGGSMQKIRTPLEFIASSVRALRSLNNDGSATATTDGYAFVSPLSRMGVMSLFNRAEPDGYPEYGAAWISAGTLAERLRFVQSLLTASDAANPSRPGDAGNNFGDPVALLQKKLPAAQLRNAGAVVDYFLGILFPGEGRANLEQYRTEAINFLNIGGPFDALAVDAASNTPYDNRVRGMVSFLMTTQRFQEQ